MEFGGYHGAEITVFSPTFTFESKNFCKNETILWDASGSLSLGHVSPYTVMGLLPKISF